MKIFTTITRVVLVGIIFLLSHIASAQNNTPWSTTGNIGIGTSTSGYEKLVIRNNGAQLLLQSASEPSNYYTRINSNYSYPTAFVITAKGGANERNIITWGEETGMTFNGGYTPKFTFNGNIGIGTSNPQGGLEIFKGATNNVALVLNSSGPGWGSGMYFVNSAPSGKSYGIYSGGDGRFHFGNVATGVDNLVLDQNGNVGIGATLSTNPNNYKLAVKGRIGAQEVIVETTSTTWADYVFENTYNLRPLSQVESFIKENKHLPEIPSAKEVEANGINLGEMDALLLKKIEELTLYMIEMKKENEELKKEDKRIQKENEEIKMKNTSLEQEIQQLKTK